MIGTRDLEVSQGPLQTLVMQDGERLHIAERAWLVLTQHLLDALLTVVLPAATDEVWLTEDHETHGTGSLDEGGRGLLELAVVPTLGVSREAEWRAHIGQWEPIVRVRRALATAGGLANLPFHR